MTRVVLLAASVGAVARRAAGAAAARRSAGDSRRPASRRLALADLRRQLRQPPPQPADADHAATTCSACQPQWTFQTGTLGNFQTTSLLRDNVLYVTGPQNVAWAIDARTGRQIWRYRRELPRRPHRVLRPGEPRLRRPRRQAVHDDARRAPARARHEDRRHRRGTSTMEDYKKRLRRHHRAARRQGQGDRRRGRRRVRLPLLHRRLRRADRQARLALLHHSRPGRAGQRHLGRRFVEARRREHLGHRRLRSRAEPRLLRHRQSGPRLSQRQPRGRQPLQRFDRRARRRHRASCAGTTSSRRTTCTTGTRRRCRSSPTSPSAASRARW